MNCIFCNIINGTLASVKIWENDDFVAILDVFPNVKGQTLLITKQHYCSDFFDQMPQPEFQNFFSSAQHVIKLLKSGLNVHRVALVVEGMGINHAHIKLYPLHGLSQNFQEMVHTQQVYFENYQGYVSTQIGPKADIGDLTNLAEQIKKITLV